MISDDDIRQLEELEREATPGPWEYELDEFDHAEGLVATVADKDTNMLAVLETGIIDVPNPGGDWTEEKAAIKKAGWEKAKAGQELKDAAFIAAARNALPKLIAAYRMQERVVEAARNLVTMCQEDECFTDPSDPGPYAALKNTELQLAALDAARAGKGEP
jgi:hypothetical protein